ncbi:hypothetical protein [Nonomuraea sp. CA-141351]|uniref:hypothetical protein n=1 Tax=Nonomuraea sp. CA-141351 TaxID=3239996 RepID=UPI003D89F213
MEIQQPQPELQEPEQISAGTRHEVEILDREPGADGDVAFAVHQAAEAFCFFMP